MALNVCLLNDSFPPIIDGVANSVLNYAGVIQEQLGQCTVVTPHYPDITDDYIFPVIRYPSLNTVKATSGYRAGYPFSSKTLSLLEQKEFDVIHSHCPFSSGLLARTLRERLEAPYVFTYHTKFDIEINKVFESESMQRLTTRLLINNISAADEIWAVSQGAGDNLRSMGYEGEIVIMENGVDMPAQRVAEQKVQALRHELALPDVPVFLFVGRCMWYKGLQISLDAMKALLAQGKDFRFIIVGDGLDRAEIEVYAKAAGLEKHCLFVGSVYDREKLRAYFALSDVFIFPSTYDTNGLVVREAAANAVGSIIIDGSCAAEGITDGRNGLLIEETADSLAAKLYWACDNRDTLRTIGQCAQKEIYISWQDAVTKAYRRYEHLVELNQSGKLPRRDTFGNGFFELLADWNAVMAKLQGVPRQVLDKTSSVYSRFKKKK